MLKAPVTRPHPIVTNLCIIEIFLFCMAYIKLTKTSQACYATEYYRQNIFVDTEKAIFVRE